MSHRLRRWKGMAASAVMPGQRPVSDADAEEIRAAKAAVEKAQLDLERKVTKALKHGASVRSVAALGFATNTVLKYGHSHGWPTPAERAKFNESRWDRYRDSKD